MQSKRHRQRLGADLGRGILLRCCLDVVGCGNMLNVGRGGSLACPKPWLKVWHCWVHPGDGGGRPQLCPQFRCKIERTAKNLFSPLQPESTSAFLSIGLQPAFCCKASLVLPSTDTRQESPSCKGSKWKRSGLAEHPPEEERALCVQTKEMACLRVIWMLPQSLSPDLSTVKQIGFEKNSDFEIPECWTSSCFYWEQAGPGEDAPQLLPILHWVVQAAISLLFPGL